MRRKNIPANILAAARRSGLKVPLWYVGPHVDPDAPRKSSLEAIVAEVEAEERREAPWGDQSLGTAEMPEQAA
jgi:hypothetical protein